MTNQEISTLKEELKKAQLAYLMASEMSQFKAGFLARISHELRSPLNSLIGLHQLILSDLCEDAAEERDFVSQAHGSALRLVKMLDEILNVSKLEHGSNRLDIQRLYLGEMFGQLYELTHLQAANHNLRLQISHPEPEIYVLADLRWFRQVLVNLVDTPLKIMDEGSVKVWADTDAASGYANIWIEDERPADAWREPIDLLQTPPQTDVGSNATISPGLSILADLTLLELMKGRLELVTVPSPEDGSNLSRIKCSIPLATQTPSPE